MAAAVAAICSERNGSGVASSGGDPAAGAQKPSMGDTRASDLVKKNTAAANSNNTTEQEEEEEPGNKISPFPQPPSPVDYI